MLVSNVPFGDYNISDDKYSMHIHDYFFVKGLDSLRTGGIMAFITSKGTLDKLGSTVRRQIAQRADLLGAVRLPNSAFRRIAGTEVTTDIVFLQKRAVPPEELPDWVYLAPYPSNPEISVNSYYIDNPHMMLGTMVERSGMYGGKDTALTPSATWEVDLFDSIKSIQGSYQERSAVAMQEKSNAADLPDDGTTPKFTYCVKNDNLYYCDRVMLRYQSFDKTKTARIKGMNDIRLATRAVIAVQQSDAFTPQALADCHAKLNTVYDQFVKKYGNINSRVNQLAFAEDIDIALISSLENINEDGTYRKAEFFSKATIKRTVRALYADTAQDALSISLNEKSFVDLEYMQLLTGLTKAKLVEDLGERIYLDHNSTLESPRYVTTEEYLSGDVRTALYEVSSIVEERPELQANLQALEAAQPEWIPAVDIGVKLSSNWIGAETVNQFIYELLSTPKVYQGSDKKKILAVYSRHNNVWTIYNKGVHKGLVATAKYGTDRMSAYYIIEATLNQREVTVRDAKEEDGKTVYKYNHEETVAARQKQEVINESFNDWIFADADRRNRLEHTYNHTFNRTRSRVYDGSYLTLSEANPHISLEPHQLNAVARIRTGGSTLLAHVVGAGKTYAMVAGGMELLRLKVAHKLLYVVPNHLIGDFAQDFLTLYPTANVLVPSDKDFEKSRRYRFIAKIATADIDAIVIGHSQFEKIDITPERKAMEIERELEALEHVLESVDSEETPRYTVKKLEKTRQSLMDRMSNLLSSKDKDGMLYFEELGVDCLFVDEAHNYKNGALNSKMSNISGVSSSSSLKASDMLAKTRYLTEVGASVVYATGTCVSNSVCELYVMQRYLQEGSLQQRDIYHFDEWASNFGETVTSIEVKPEGGGYRSKTRFAQFFNLPELMSMFTEVADIQTAEMLNLKKPELEGGKAIVIACEPSQELLEFMNVCVYRAQDIRSGAVKSHHDNMLKLTNEARKAGTDMRLLGERYSFDPNGKIAMCAEHIVSDLNECESFRGTVLVFSDIGTPSEKFNVYDELRRLLILRGVPEGEIAFIHEAKNGTDRKKLFKDMRTGVRRVLVGSTEKCGAGTNIQKRLYSLHHLDCPWRPSDIEQREGRILRQGNDNKVVRIYRYVTKRSFDSYLWQLVEQKQRFISQVMSGKNIGRTCKDIDETVLSFAEVKAIASGDPRIKESMELQMDVEKLEVLKRQHTKEQHRLQDLIRTRYPQEKANLLNEVEAHNADLLTRQLSGASDFAIELQGIAFDERSKAGEALQEKLLACQPKFGSDIELGQYKGFKLMYSAVMGGNVIKAVGKLNYSVDVGGSGLGNIQKIENRIAGIEQMITQKEERLFKLDEDIDAANKQLAQPFSKAQELLEKQQRLVSLTAEINIAAGQVTEISSAPDIEM